jgi:tRNA(Ile)-lysidine synthase
VEQTIRRHAMFSPGASVLAGLSGGPDSTALVSVLHALAPRWGLTLHTVHINHGLRETAGRDAARAREFALSLGLPHHETTLHGLGETKGKSLEEAGREARHACFKSLCAEHGLNAVALGHHADDNAETVLLFLLRGAGATGLSGIPPVRADGIVRPLIETRRKDILEYLAAEHIPFVEDETNQDHALVRNRVRHLLLPLLEREFNPGITAGLGRLSEILRGEEAYWEEVCARQLKEITLAAAPEALRLDAGKLASLHPALGRRVLRLALRALSGDLRRIQFQHAEALLALISRDSGGIHLPGGLFARKSGAALELENKGGPGRAREKAGQGPKPGEWELLLPGPGEFPLPGGQVMLSLLLVPPEEAPPFAWLGPGEALLDADKAPFPLVLRPARPGDRFRPLGAPGEKTVARFLMDRKVPSEKRKQTLVLVSGDSLVWTAGHRVSHRARVESETRLVLAVKLFLA